MKKIFSLLIMSIFLFACQSSPEHSPSSNLNQDSYNYNNSNVPFGTQADLEENVGDRVMFDLNSSSLNSTAQDTLIRQAAWLKRNSALTIVIEGHCDQRGPREYNLGLAERRANAAKQFLISAGVNSERISVISYGKERPEIAENNRFAWAKNRRAVTVIE